VPGHVANGRARAKDWFGIHRVKFGADSHREILRMAVQLSNKVVVITGASSGIGAATAVACANAGMDVVLAARREDRLRQVAGQVERLGRRAVVVPCDVQRDEDVERLFRRTVDDLGRLDVLFANAGYGLFSRIAETDQGRMRDIFETNFWGTVRCVQAAVPIMRRRGGGHLMICTSAVSEIGIPMYGFYAATKAAQDSLAGALRAEVADDEIVVTSVHPIGTATEFFDVVTRVSPDARGELKQNTPARLVHSAAKVAAAVVRCMRRPRPEVWPSRGARVGLALTTAAPSLSAWAMGRLFRSRYHVRPQAAPQAPNVLSNPVSDEPAPGGR
jgi:short-subunit dehydrogenase